MTACAVPGCPNNADDPRYFVHVGGQALPACDAHGCSRGLPCDECRDDDTGPPDVVLAQIRSDVWYARYTLRKAEQALVHAKRALELREAELARYRKSGAIPKRKRIAKAIEEVRDRQARAAGLVGRARGSS